MRVGIALPNVVRGVSDETLLEWARRAEAGPFTSLGVLDRRAWGTPDPIDTLLAVSPETERLNLATTVVVGPLRTAEQLAKEAGEVQAASGGRLVLGLSVGARTEDYEAAGVDPRGRGRRFDEQLVALPGLWEAAGVEPPPVLVGGGADIAFARMARFSSGYVHGGGPPRAFAGAALKARAAWADYARPGSPRLWGQSYFVLGDEDTVERGRAYMREYYAFTGPFVERIVEGLLTTPQAVAQQVRGYAEEGCDELVMVPGVADPDQVDRLGEVLAG